MTNTDTVQEKITYTAITIGPIVSTLQRARSTKASWAASYTISYIAKQIIRAIRKQGLAERADFILPYFEADDLERWDEVGLFADRIVIKGSINGIRKITDDVLKTLSTLIAKDLSEKVEEVYNYCNAHFNIRVLEPIELTESVNKEVTNVMFETYQLLDVAELQNAPNLYADADYLVRFFEKVPGFENSLTYNHFHNKAFPEKRKFPSTPEIATAEFEKDSFYEGLREILNKNPKNTNNDQRQEKFYKDLRTWQGDKFRNYQKYMVVVKADGDNFGKLISAIYKHKPELTTAFSEAIFSFTRMAAIAVSKVLNGYPVFAGGDDLLFFAPLAHTHFNRENVEEIKTIFDVIDEIDDLFSKTFYNDRFKEAINESEKPLGMSFGISMAYYKFPLAEIQNCADFQLFGIAKKTAQKNAISFEVLKHSGHKFGTTFFKPKYEFDKDIDLNQKKETKPDQKALGLGTAYKAFQNLLKISVESSVFLKNIAFTLMRQKRVLFGIGREKELLARNAYFQHFFIQNFNESVHQKKNDKGQKELIPFLTQLLEFCQAIYTENPLNPIKKATKESNKNTPEKIPKNEEEIHEENIMHLDATLQFIAFIHNKEEA